jgi:hypothetical protein
MKIFDFDTINYKPIENGVIDLTRSVFDYTNYVTIREIIVISDTMEGKPWLISKIYYGSEKYLDILCFFNGISNPLTIKKGDVLFIPDLDGMINALQDLSASNPSENPTNNKLSTLDQNRVRQLLSNIGDNVIIKNPNQVPPNVDQNTVEDGTITLGTSSTICRSANSGTQSRSDRIRAAVITKIKNE